MMTLKCSLVVGALLLFVCGQVSVSDPGATKGTAYSDIKTVRAQMQKIMQQPPFNELPAAESWLSKTASTEERTFARMVDEYSQFVLQLRVAPRGQVQRLLMHATEKGTEIGAYWSEHIGKQNAAFAFYLWLDSLVDVLIGVGWVTDDEAAFSLSAVNRAAQKLYLADSILLRVSPEDKVIRCHVLSSLSQVLEQQAQLEGRRDLVQKAHECLRNAHELSLSVAKDAIDSEEQIIKDAFDLLFSLQKRTLEEDALKRPVLAHAYLSVYHTPEERRFVPLVMSARLASSKLKVAALKGSNDISQLSLEYDEAYQEAKEYHQQHLPGHRDVVYVRFMSDFAAMQAALCQYHIMRRDALKANQYLARSYEVLVDILKDVRHLSPIADAECLEILLQLSYLELMTDNVAIRERALSHLHEAQLLAQKMARRDRRNLQGGVLGLDPDLFGLQTSLRSIHFMARDYLQQGKYESAEKLYQDVLKHHEKVYGVDDPRLCPAICDLLYYYGQMGTEQLWAPYLERLEVLIGGTDNIAVEKQLDNYEMIWRMYSHLRLDIQREKVAKQALEVCEREFGACDNQTIYWRSKLGEAQLSLGNTESEDTLRLKNFSCAEEVVVTTATINFVYDAALDAKRWGRREDAIRILQRCHRFLEIESRSEISRTHVRQNVHEYDPEVVEQNLRSRTMLLQLANTYADLGEFELAEDLLEETIEGLEGRESCADLVFLIWCRCSLAVLYHSNDRYRDAAKTAKEALAYVKKFEGKTLGEDDLIDDVGLGVTRKLGFLVSDQSEYAGVCRVYREWLLAKCEPTGKDGWNPYQLAQLGEALKNMAMYEDVEGVYRLALNSFPLDRTRAGRYLAEISEACAYQQEWATAISSRVESIQYTYTERMNILHALSSKEQRQHFLLHTVPAYHRTMSLVSHHGESNSYPSCGEVHLNLKGMGFEAMVHQVQLLEQVDTPEVAKARRDLLGVGSMLAGRTGVDGRVQASSDSSGNFAALQVQYEDALRNLARLVGHSRGRDEWVTLGKVRTEIPEEAILVDIVRYQNSDSEGGSEEYLAWIIPPHGILPLRLVHLGDATLVDRAIASYRKALVSTAMYSSELGQTLSIVESSKPNSDGTKKQLSALAQVLAELIWNPIEEIIGDAKSILLSPDSQLWLVPWAALPSEDGRFLVEDLQFRYLISGRHLAVQGDTNKSSGAVLFADPDFSSTATGEIHDTSKGAYGPRIRSVNMGGEVKLERLEKTAEEADIVRPLIEQYTGSIPLVLTQTEASEASFKELNAPQVVLLATHGFALSKQVPSNAVLTARGKYRGLTVAKSLGIPSVWSPTTSLEHLYQLESPLLRCGLFLACSEDNTKVSSENDGVLTGQEIVRTNLRNTELVVMSACETGLGDIQDGEGVAGIRHALQLAGVRSVIATLWQIPDTDVTVGLMKAFWNNLANGQGKAEALRNAQLSIIKQLRAEEGYAHPYYWAAFTLTGDD